MRKLRRSMWQHEARKRGLWKMRQVKGDNNVTCIQRGLTFRNWRAEKTEHK